MTYLLKFHFLSSTFFTSLDLNSYEFSRIFNDTFFSLRFLTLAIEWFVFSFDGVTVKTKNCDDHSHLHSLIRG